MNWTRLTTVIRVMQAQALLIKVAGSSKMRDTINKLFGKCSTPNTSKVKSITHRMVMSKDPGTKKGTKRKASIVIDDGENAVENEKKK